MTSFFNFYNTGCRCNLQESGNEIPYNPHVILISGVRRGTITTCAMGKDKKPRLHQALAQDILDADAPRRGKKSRTPKVRQERSADADDEYVEDRLSRKILEQARLQQEELEEEHGIGQDAATSKQKTKRKKGVKGVTFLGPPRDGSDGEDQLGLSDDEEFPEEPPGGSRECCPVVSEEDDRAMQLFMSKEEPARKTLADIIMEKIRDKQTEIGTLASERPVSAAPHMDEKVVAVFKGVAEILSKYRSGKLPKAFKVIPSLSNWEEVLSLTKPENWTAAAMFQATKIFASNLSAAKAQSFYNLVLLPRIRDDIAEYKRLNFHLYMALKKSLFKPAAFFKGILLPLCRSGNCTLREALVIASALAKTSVPMLHSAAAVLKIAEMEYSGANSIFLRTLLDKKYALPYHVVDAVFSHFARFVADPRPLPVLWHQSLLAFVQRHKEDMSLEQKEGLMDLVRVKTHHEISHEVRRELLQSRCRDLGGDVLFVDRHNPSASHTTSL